MLNLSDTVAIALGGRHSCARRADGSLWCWGSNSKGQRDHALPDEATEPVKVQSVHCRCGDGTCGVDESNASCPIDCRDAACGDGVCAEGELESCPSDCSNAALQFDLGSSHSCAVMSNGTVWCWGDNGYGQLGDSTEKDRRLGTGIIGFNVRGGVTLMRLTEHSLQVVSASVRLSSAKGSC